MEKTRSEGPRHDQILQHRQVKRPMAGHSCQISLPIQGTPQIHYIYVFSRFIEL